MAANKPSAPLSASDKPHSGEELRQIAHEKQIPLKRLAEILEISPQALNNWLTRGIPASRIRDVSIALDLPEDVFHYKNVRKLAGARPEQAVPSAIDKSDTVLERTETLLTLPIIERQYLTQYTTDLELRDIDQSITIEKDWLVRHGLGGCNSRRLGVAIAGGQQMMDTFRDGDLLLFESTMGELWEDGVYLFYLRGVMTCRRIQLLPEGKVLLISDSSAYRDQCVNVSYLDIFARVHMVLNARLL